MLRELRDGVTLLKVLDIVEPGIVTWSRASLRPRSRAKMVENANYVVNLGKAMDFGLTNVTGSDIVEGSPSVVLPFLLQLMRYYTLRTLSDTALSGFGGDEGEVLKWANKRVSSEAVKAGLPGDKAQVRTFGDTELATGIYLLYLVNSLRPCVSWKAVTDGEGREQQGQNALYVLTLARKLGAVTSCTWEDIVDVKPRKIVLLVASLIEADARMRRGDQPEEEEDDEEGEEEEDGEDDE
jgi:plastin-1